MIDIAAYAKNLVNSGVDQKLQDIADTTNLKMAAVEALDIAAGDPSALFAVTDDAFQAIKSGGDSLLAQAAALQPKLPKLQDMMGEVLAGGSSAGISALLEKAGGAAAGLPNVASLSGDVLGSLKVPNIGGLDAAAAQVAGQVLGAASGAIPGAGFIKNAAGGLQAALTVPSLGDLPSIPDITSGGFDPGSMIPNIEFDTVPEFDIDGIQIGEKIIAIKLGSPAIVPVQDAITDAIPDPVKLKEVAATAKNIFLSDPGLLASLSRSMINTYDGPVTTEVVKDPVTGENIVYETQVDEDGEPVMVPSGFPSQAAFNFSYNQGRQAAIGHVQKALGQLKTVTGENTTVFQDTAKLLSKVLPIAAALIKPPLPTKAPGKARIFQLDPVTGASVNQENLMNVISNLAVAANAAKPGLSASIKKLDKSTTSFFNQLGKPLPPGSEPASFNEEDTEL
jgi:hypothetical protein